MSSWIVSQAKFLAVGAALVTVAILAIITARWGIDFAAQTFGKRPVALAGGLFVLAMYAWFLGWAVCGVWGERVKKKQSRQE